MKFKKIILITLLLFAVLTISSVSAADNLTDEGALQDAPSEEIELSEDANEEVIETPASNEELSSTITVEGNTFSDIQTAVNNAKDGDTIKLDGTYIFDGSSSYGINIKKENLTIDGGGTTVLDDIMFKINDDNIVIKNIKFINGHAINCYGNNALIENCQFINCDGGSSGGAIYISSRVNVDVTNCVFENCSATVGAAIYVEDYSTCDVFNSRFEKCSASSLGGVLDRVNGQLNRITAYNCIFKDNLCPITTSGAKIINDNANNQGSNSQSSSGTSSSSSSSTSKTTKSTPKLTVNKVTFKAKAKTKKYSAILKTNKNKAMNKIKLYLKVKGKTYTAKTNSKGKAIFKIKNLKKKGTYKATVTFKGNSNYNKVTKTVKIKVK